MESRFRASIEISNSPPDLDFAKPNHSFQIRFSKGYKLNGMGFVRSIVLLAVLGFWMLTAPAFAAPAELFVFEPSLQRIVGYGVVNGSEFQLSVNSYSGSIKALWSREGRSPVAFGGNLNAGQLQLIGSNNQTLELPRFLSDQGFFVRIVTTRVQTNQPIGIPSSAENPKPATGGSNPPSPNPAP